MSREFTHAIPKAELHAHIEASLEPELLFRFAERNGHPLPYESLEDAREAARSWSDLVAFLDMYYMHIGTLQTEADYSEVVESYVERSAAQGLRHVELFFDPQAHTRRGVPLGTVLGGLVAGFERGEREHGVTGALMACFIREMGVDAARETLAELAGLDDFDRVVAIGLDSIEEGYPPQAFASLYADAERLGLRKVIHAGEAGPGENVAIALRDLGVDRIDHGPRCIEVPDSLNEVLERRTTLTMCPRSNVLIGLYDSLADHPVAELMRMGVNVTINSDSPAYFGGYVADHWVYVEEEFDLSEEEIVELARCSVRSSFASDARKAEIEAEIDTFLAERREA
ncbi:MAG: adenosine deaminase [Actinobacteria bacterium]|nr:adenosine deaminase [Actinomycetota bacterium]